MHPLQTRTKYNIRRRPQQDDKGRSAATTAGLMNDGDHRHRNEIMIISNSMYILSSRVIGHALHGACVDPAKTSQARTCRTRPSYSVLFLCTSAILFEQVDSYFSMLCLYTISQRGLFFYHVTIQKLQYKTIYNTKYLIYLH